MAYEPPRRKPGARPVQIQVDGVTYRFVTRQRADTTAIYKSENAFLRIGDASKIRDDLSLHLKMVNLGFPVSKIISSGHLGDEDYFTESSLGENHLGELFAKDVEQHGVIRDGTFEKFVKVASSFARAQLETQTLDTNFEGFSRGILLDALCEELPDWSARISARFHAASERLSKMPFVLSHGDFNPNNLYPDGVIDLEDSFYGPFGYDLIGSICHIDSFPDSQEFEFYAKYRFTTKQKEDFLIAMDSICAENNVPEISRCASDYEFCRAVWLAAKIPHVPKLQSFRYDLIKKLV